MVARHDQDYEPSPHRLYNPKRHVDRNDQNLICQGIKVGTDLGRHSEALGQKAVDAVADASNQKEDKCNRHLVRSDGPDHYRHQQDASKRDEIGKAQGYIPAGRQRRAQHYPGRTSCQVGIALFSRHRPACLNLGLTPRFHPATLVPASPVFYRSRRIPRRDNGPLRVTNAADRTNTRNRTPWRMSP